MKYSITFMLLLVLAQPIASQTEPSTLIYGNGYQLGDVEIEGDFDINNIDDIIEAQFSTDGTKYYTLSFPNIVMQHSLTIPYDISSISGSNLSFVSSIFDDIRGFHLSPNGEKLFISGDNQFFGSTYGSNVVQYDLPNPFDITTGTTETFFEWRYPFIPCYCEISGISFSYDGLTMYAIVKNNSFNSDRIYQFPLNNPFDLSGLTVDYSGDASNFIFASILRGTGPRIDSAQSLTFDPTGKDFFVLVHTQPDAELGIPSQARVLRLRAGTPFDITTLQFVGDGGKYITNETSFEQFQSLTFNTSGTKMFLGRIFSNPVRVLNINDSNNFKEVSANNGAVEGQQKIRIAGDAKFSNPSGTLTYNTDYEITNLPSGLVPNLAVSGDGITATLTLSGNATNSQATNSLENLSFTFFGAAFNIGSSSGVLNAVEPSSGISITFNNRPPDARCKNFILAELDATGQVTISPSDVDDGSTAEGGIQSLRLDTATFDCSDANPNITFVTLTVTDNLGFTDSCTQLINIVDRIDPSPVCKDITVQLNNDGIATITGAQLDDGSTDNCEVASFSVSPNTFDCSNLGENLVTLTVTDRFNNTATCTATVTVETNTILPTAICQDITVQLDASGTVSIVGTEVNNGSIFNQCIAAPSFSVVPDSFDCTDIGENTVTLTLTDGNGQTSSCNAIVIVEDNTAPLIECKNITVQLDTTGNASIIPTDIFEGGLNACGVDSLAIDISTFDCSSIGDNTVVLTATGTNGTTGSCSAIVTVEDSITPTAICQDITLMLDNTGVISFDPSDLDGGSIDNCEITKYHLSPTNTITNSNAPDVLQISGIGQSFISNTTGFLSKVSVLANENFKNLDLLFYDSANGSGISSSPGTPIYTESGIKLIDSQNGVIWTDIYLSTPLPVEAGNSYSFVFPPEESSSVGLYGGPDSYSEGTFIFLYGNALSNNDLAFEVDFFEIPVFDCSDIGSSTTYDLIVLDASGNSDTCTANVTIEENTPPVVVCQDITVPLDTFGNASITAADIDGGSTDNCGIATTSINISDFTCSEVGANDVVLTVIDESGNISTCTAVVTIADNIPPLVACQDITVQLDTTGNVSITGEDIDGGSTDMCGIASYSVSPSSFSCADVGTNSVTLTVTDIHGNAVGCTATVTVEDKVAPVAACQDITVQLDAFGNVTIDETDINNGSTDACGIASLSISETSFNCDDVGANTVTLTVTDVNGNVSTCTSTVTVEDNIAPVAICKDITVQLDAFGNVTINGADVDNGSADACGIPSLSVTPNSFTCTDVGPNMVTLTATDANGNIAICTSTVTVEDNIAPDAICKDITVQLDAFGNVTIDANDVDNGSSDTCGIASLVVSETSFICTDVGSNTVTLTVTDTNGNIATCTSTVMVEDKVAPVAACQDITVQLDAFGNVTIDANDIDNGSVDACGIASIVASETSFTCADVGENIITLTVTDVNGNVATCMSTVTVEDHVAPVALCQPFTAELDATGNVTINGADVDGGSTDACGIASLSVSPNMFSCADIGTPQNVTLTVTDNNGNVSTCTTIVTVEDNEAPVITCAANDTRDTDLGICTYNVVGTEFDVTATDNCNTFIITNDLNGTATIAGETLLLGTTVVTWTVDDGNGQSDTCTTTITVEDNEAPMIMCTDFTRDTDPNVCQYTVVGSDFEPVFSDNCTTATISNDYNNTDTLDGAVFPLGDTTVTWTVDDGNGQTATCTSTVTIEDNQAPIIGCPADVVVSTDPDSCLAMVQFSNPSVIENCGGFTITQTVGMPSGSLFPIGINNIGFSVTDGSGNVSTCSFTITVEDNTDPVAVCQDITVQLDESGSVTISAADINNGSTDNCNIMTTAIDIDTFDCNDVGDNTVTLTVTDRGGNTSSCTATVTVEDVTAPVVVCQDITVQLGADGTVTLDASLLDGGSSDACGIDSFTASPATLDCSNIGSNTVTLTVTDVNGNSSTCEATVEVEDTIAPTLVCQPAVISLEPDGTATVDPTVFVDMSNPVDNCNTITYTIDVSMVDCDDVGTTIDVTIFADDGNGNFASCMTTMTVEDVTGPIFDASTLPQGPITRFINPATGIYRMENFRTRVIATDDCSLGLLPITLQQDPPAGTELGVGVYDVTITAVDDAGNMTDYVFELRVETTLGTGDVNLSTLVLYPNPMRDRVVLSNPNGLNLKDVSIFDLQGRLVQKVNVQDMTTEKVIDISQLQAASYVFVITGESGTLTKTMIKE